jgi:eukaryotic-like serine/threonine-protein kinase
LVVPRRGHALERPHAVEGQILNSLPHGAIVGERYKIVAPLARGGFGAVYVAEQLTTERRVALKVLARYAEDVSVEKLLAEARVTSRVLSDHIVQVLDAGLDATTGNVFVVMELLRGTTLEERLLAHGALPAEEVAEVLRQVAVGLDKAHGHSDRQGRPAPIVHRDLKPSNIFLTSRDDGQPLLKILDFGAAKVLTQSAKASGLVHGTPLFMASEQALGEPSSPGTDIWALGLTAFNLLTGSSYWLSARQDGTEAQLLAEILMLPLVPASQRVRQLGQTRELPAAFDGWFSRCVNRDSSQRFSSAGAAAFELSRVLGVKTAELSEPASQAPQIVPAAVAATQRAESEKRLETIAALAHTPTELRPSRARASLALLGLMLAGAVMVLLWKRAPVATPSPPSVRANPLPSGSSVVAPARREPPAVTAASAAQSAERPVAASTAALSAPRATTSGRAKSPEKRTPPSVRARAPLQAATGTRDPYQER